MSFTDAIKGKKIDTQKDISSSPKKDIDFDVVVKKLKDDSDISISTLGFLLGKIGTTLNDRNSSEVMLIISELNKAKSYEIMKKYVVQIEEISVKYNKQKKQTSEDAGNEGKGLIESITSGVKGFFLDSNSLNKIQEIDIDGKVESITEFQSKLKDLISVVKNDSKFEKLDSSDRSKVISGLEKIGTGLEQEANKTLDFLDNKINNLGRQVENQSGGVINLNIEGETISFDSKREAFLFVKMLKQEAENEFQSISTDLAEIVGSTIFFLFSSDVPLKPYIWTRDSIYDGIENYQDNDHGILLAIDGLQALTLLYLSVNYTETIYRRLIIDVAANLPYERTKKWARLGDFGRQRLVFQGSENPKDVEKKERYNRRLDAIDYLKNNLSEVKPKYKNAYLKELKSIESYLNTDSRTFWLKFRALREDHGIFRRPIAIFTRGWFSFDIEKSQSDYINSNNNAPITKIKEGLEYAFNNVEVIVGDDGNRTINVGEESKVIKDIRSYIDTIDDSSKRKSTFDNLDKFLEKLKTEPMSVDNIKGQLYNIVENNYYDIDNIVNEINKKYFKDVDVVQLERRGFFKHILKLLDFFKGNLSEVNKVMVEVWGKYAPTSLTSGQALAIKLRERVKAGRWQSNSVGIKDIFDRIDSGKLELNSKFPGLKKVMIPVQMIKSMFGKYGIEMPKIAALDKYGDTIENKTFEDKLKIGSERSSEIEKAKKIFSGEIVENLSHVFNLDSEKFPSKDKDKPGEIEYGKGSKEVYFEKMHEELKNTIDAGELRLTPDEVKLELVKMYEGYLTNQKIKSEISDSFKKAQRSQENIKDFIKKVETGRWIGTLREFKAAILELKSGKTVDEKIVTLDVEVKIAEIKSKGVKFKEIDFMDQKFGIFEVDGKINIDSYKSNEGELLRLIRILNGNTNSSNELGVLFQTINRDSINYTSIEFFEELNKALGVGFDIDEHTTRDSYRKMLVSEIEPKLKAIIIDFDTKGIDDKKVVVEKLKDILGISKDDLSSTTTKALKAARFNIGLYTDKITNFENEKEELRIEETKKADRALDDKKMTELERMNQVKDLDTQIKYLEKFNLPTTIEEVKDAHSDFDKRDVFIKFEYPSTLVGVENSSLIKNETILENEVSRLKSEKLKLENPKEYFARYLDEVSNKLEKEGIHTSILDGEYEKIINGTDIDTLIESGKTNNIFDSIKSRAEIKFRTIHGGLKFKIARNIFDSIRKNGFKITR